MNQEFYNLSFRISEQVTKHYSTSFYIATKLLNPETRKAIHSIYGFVRFADEIVDTFHEFDKKYLIEKFEYDYYDSLKQELSLNPVLNAFQHTVTKYNISNEHIQAFLQSMKDDLKYKDYKEKNEVDSYIYGSADVVGLMCLKVFCNGNDDDYLKLENSARKLASAFQKVNFLRDLKNDIELLERNYFPDFYGKKISDGAKMKVITDIENDFEVAFEGIKELPDNSKLAVLVAYLYYRNLLRKIKNTKAEKIMETRIRISNGLKLLLLLKGMFIYKLRLI